MDKFQDLQYGDLLKNIKFYDAFMLILESWNALTGDVFTNCYNKSIENVKLNIDDLSKLNEDLRDLNDFYCYEVYENDADFLEAIKIDIMENKHVPDDFEDNHI
ncbi:hypothetical protein DMUE_5363 [Dictyocoela muelleri]|nr:hypothetical protein DMUE_5363 [Dictyocoela muelleri]